MSAVNTISETNFDDLRLIHRGKVRDVYDLHENRLLLVATDRISAFDCIMPTQIPNKGEILTSISAFWFEFLSDITANHLLTTNFEEMPENVRRHEILRERSTLVKKTKVFPVECVVRGYLEGSGWKDYQATGEVCGHKLPAGMLHCEKLSAPIFTPATKAEKGHDENISEARFAEIIGTQNAVKLKNLSLEIYKKASQYALKKGIIIADTKFEFGLDEDENILLIDEVLTPDSSRFWSAETFEPGHVQASFDKQFLREYLETLGWDKKPPAPALPENIVQATRSKYLEAFQTLVGS